MTAHSGKCTDTEGGGGGDGTGVAEGSGGGRAARGDRNRLGTGLDWRLEQRWTRGAHGTGPYMISQYQPGTPVSVVRNPYFRQPCAGPGCRPWSAKYRPNASLTLVRNPCFRQWSYAAQPTGYPDVIRFERVADPGKQVSAVIAGRADLVDLFLNGLSYPDLATRYPDPGARRPQAVHHVLVSEHPVSRRLRASRHGKPSTTLSTAPGCSSFSTSAQVRPL